MKTTLQTSHFFTGKARGSVKHTQPFTNEVTENSTDFEKKELQANRINAKIVNYKSKEVVVLEKCCPWIENRGKKDEEKVVVKGNPQDILLSSCGFQAPDGKTFPRSLLRIRASLTSRGLTKFCTMNEKVGKNPCGIEMLAESCEFEVLCESLIRDRLVISTRDSATRDRLLREHPVPNLTRYIEALRASELSRKHKEQLKDAVSDPQNIVHAAYKQGLGNRKDMNQSKVNKTKQMQSNASSVAPITLMIELNVPPQEKLVLNVANKDILPLSFWKRIVIQVCQPTRYMTQVQHQDMQRVPSQHSGEVGEVELDAPGGNIRLYDGRVVKPLGSYTFTVSLKSRSKCETSFDILENAPWPIVDGNTSIKQGWICLGPDQSIHSLNSENYEPLSFDKLMRDFEDVFTGLGCLPGEYHTEIDPDIRLVQHTPRREPVPLKAKLKEKIDEMEKQGIIVQENKPTDWISSLVAVQKPGKLRVCIDPRDLNRAIKRSKYQMPTVDEVLLKLAKAKVFTVLDAKDGFYQIKLDKESSLLTTFLYVHDPSL
ncbi:Retrovirus-related Pol polyprotein [Stylophora pistillata]|uniref:Retrovirus-related Pol polyprotein n=1 Tax=Stylophora pistillata TaxID=50429 RepID=A0A2B4T102_STYPI|nr:Retrovirus-related Pol polyprotein [Stylophora pistillata]